MEPAKSPISKLTGTSNYQVWSIKMKAYLIAQDLWSIVEISSLNTEVSKAQSQNSKAASQIILACEDHVIRMIDPEDLAADIWKNLKKQYGQVGFSARHIAFQSLVSTNLSTCAGIDQFIDQFRTNVNTISQLCPTPLPQWLLLSILINNAANKYEAWSQSVMQQIRGNTISEDSNTQLNEIIASLIDEDRRINQNSESRGDTAMTAKKGSKSKPICRYCGKTHKSDNCWAEFPDKRPIARYPSSYHGKGDAMASEPSSSNVAFFSQNQNAKCDSWIIDSGASQHMCNDRSKFFNFRNFSTTITIANNTRMNATGRGDVKITTKDGNTFDLLNVLYVPQLASNLISVCCATKNPNIRFNFMNGKCHIMFETNIIATAIPQDSLLVLESINTYAYPSKSIDSLTWHKRLGHINYEYMCKESLQKTIGTVGQFSCESCFKNKSTRIISRRSPVRATRPLEKIHSDLAGPITPTSLGGSKYVITFTDDFSRFSWVFPCDGKLRCFEIFKTFKKAVENELGEKIAFLHCDNGGEYTSNEWKHFAREEGFQILYTLPYTPEQNGVAERLNRTLFNMTRCFLSDSTNLTKPLWAELVRTSCYIKNRTPSSSNDKYASPFEVLFKRRPPIEHLRVIGSKCYRHKTGNISGKLEERSVECILVGYESPNIFRVYEPATKKVLRSRDIIICENKLNVTPVEPSHPSEEVELSNELIHVEKDNADTSNETHITNDEFHSALQSPSTDRKAKHPSAPKQSSLESKHLPPDCDTSLDELADPQYDPRPHHARAFVCNCLVAADSATMYVPESLEQAVNCEDWSHWKDSMRDEMRSIMVNHTWKLVPAPQNGAKVIQGRWVFRTKTDGNGRVIKYKSRWVVKGFQQEEGFNFSETFASVVKPMSYKVLFSIAASQDLEIEQMDVKTAFLNSPIDDEVYVEQPHGFEVTSVNGNEKLKGELLSSQTNSSSFPVSYPRENRAKSSLVCKLDKALYGLKQAPRAWYQTLSAFMKKSELEPLINDTAVFVNKNRSIFIAVYVDDILMFGKNKEQIQQLKSFLNRRFQMTDLGQAHMYLGMQITRDRKSRTINLDQQKYIHIILDRFKMLDCNSVSTPMETGLSLVKRTDKATPHEIQQYQKLIGCLEYAAMATRPDIAFAVHKLAQFSSNPDEKHSNAAKRVLRYLKGSINFSLIFQGKSTDEFKLIGYTDADWGGDTMDRKSIGGYCFYLNKCLVSHMSKKQITVALSTAEAETHAAVQAAKEAIWLRAFLEELLHRQKYPTTIFCDNQASIALSRNPEYHSRSKHVNLQFHFLRQHVKMQTISLKYIGSEKMAADGLTKPLSRQKHAQFCEFMQGTNVVGGDENANF